MGPAPLTAPPLLDDLDAELFDVTFVVVDLETTGGSPAACEITEIGAVKYRRGERVGTFQTLVNPGVPVPPFIAVLTGITDAMVLPAPRIAEVLPALLEFVGGAVLVGHNLRFDTSFLDAALVRHGYARLANRRVDTLALARRLLPHDEVADHRLGTLARHFGTSVEPTHRAFDDASATGEVLHGLIEGATGYAVSGLDDLIALPRLRADPTSVKLALTARLPRAPGVYWFRDRNERVLHVGRATDLRTRVRAYFGGRRRGSTLQLLRELVSIDFFECGELEARVRHLRLVQAHRPRHDAAPQPTVYVKLMVDERFPRLAIVRSRPRAGSIFLGPLASTVWAGRVKEAIELAVPLRRCATRLPLSGATSCACCSLDADAYSLLVERVIAGMRVEPSALLDPLRHRLAAAVAVERFEEAARARDLLMALTAAFERRRRLDAIRAAGRFRVLLSGSTVEVDSGRLVLDGTDEHSDGDARADTDAEEALVVGRWLERATARGEARLVDSAGEPLTPPAGDAAQTVGSRGRIRVR